MTEENKHFLISQLIKFLEVPEDKQATAYDLIEKIYILGHVRGIREAREAFDEVITGETKHE